MYWKFWNKGIKYRLEGVFYNKREKNVDTNIQFVWHYTNKVKKARNKKKLKQSRWN